jgi:hypothetical protein
MTPAVRPRDHHLSAGEEREQQQGHREA